ncbi:hypothetical protein GQ53DRAFT_63172 [Thozetella sp. PMI_491]|nr:hypothetical protein GQ53DRAFT_63172 [Thozetella sp. PMI_491]
MRGTCTYLALHLRASSLLIGGSGACKDHILRLHDSRSCIPGNDGRDPGDPGSSHASSPLLLFDPHQTASRGPLQPRSLSKSEPNYTPSPPQPSNPAGALQLHDLLRLGAWISASSSPSLIISRHRPQPGNRLSTVLQATTS